NTTDTFANGNPILSHVDGSNLSGVNNIQSTSNRGQAGDQAIPGGTTTADPLLALPTDNGGPTVTRVPLSGSAVINSGDDSSLQPGSSRGHPGGDGRCQRRRYRRSRGRHRARRGLAGAGARREGRTRTVRRQSVRVELPGRRVHRRGRPRRRWKGGNPGLARR